MKLKLNASITGLGYVTCVGAGPNALWKAVESERSGIDRATGLGRVDVETLRSLPDRIIEPRLRDVIARLVLDLPGSRSVLMACFSIALAMQEAGWTSLNESDGLILATTTGQFPLWDAALISFLRNEIDVARFSEALSHQPLGSLLAEVCASLTFDGERTLVTSACSASTQALAMAGMWLASGRVKRCLVGGVEALCDITIEGFRSLQLLAPRICAPFDRERSGINLSEGAAFLCLESGPSHRTGLARLAGAGFSTDGYHMTAPHPHGQGCYEAMKTALESSGIPPAEITWVHAHGTGSRHNDEAEGRAIARIFNGPLSRAPWVSSTKAVHGHALGASGAIEIALCLEAMTARRIPRTLGMSAPDPAIAIRHPASTIEAEIRHVLKSTLGFGGSNAALVLSHPREEASA